VRTTKQSVFGTIAALAVLALAGCGSSVMPWGRRVYSGGLAPERLFKRRETQPSITA
jgi:hypothetical protein